MPTTIDFSQCPMFDKAHQNSKDIDVLHEGHRDIMKEIRDMAKRIKKSDKTFTKHMGEEDVQHQITNDSLAKVNEALSVLLEDKKTRDIEEEVIVRLAEEAIPHNAVINKIKMTAVAVATVALLGALGSGVLFIYDLSKQMGN